MFFYIKSQKKFGPVILVGFYPNFNFLNRFPKYLQLTDDIKSRPVEAVYFLVNMTQLMVACRFSAKVLKISRFLVIFRQASF